LTRLWKVELRKSGMQGSIVGSMTQTHVFFVLLTALATAQGDLQRELESHDRAVNVMSYEWMRDPYIYVHGDGYFYLTATRLEEIAWGTQGIELWRSDNLTSWESIGVPWNFGKSSWLGTVERAPEADKSSDFWLWSPEIYFMDDQWVMVHTTNRRRANLLVSFGGEYNDSFDEPFGESFGHRPDPSIFTDEDGSRWLVWGCDRIAKLKPDFSGFLGEEIVIGPSDRKLGHEGCSIRKVGSKYVLFGTAWSTDKDGQGTYNLYYCCSDKLTGPYGPRKFAGRFCGHGTVFRDKAGRWWTTAFLNGTYESDPIKGQQLCEKGQPWTVNTQGLTLVPLEVRLEKDGEPSIRAKSKFHAVPGPEEAQTFAPLLPGP
jgi:xylan 1,4-beta-xylosidase